MLYYGLCASHPYRWGLCSVWMASLNSPFSSLCLLGAQVTNVCYMYVAFILLTLITMPLCFCYVLCLILFIHQPEHCLKTGGKSSLVWIRFYIFAILEIGTQAYKFYVCGFVCVCVFVLLELNRVPHVRYILLLSDMLSPVFDGLMKCIFFPVWVFFFFWIFKTRFLCMEVLEICKLTEVNGCSSNTLLEWIRKLVDLLANYKGSWTAK